MREILFRGKRKDNGEWDGEWVFGDLIRNLIYDGREKEMRIGDIYFEHNGDIHGTAVYKVVPETVGQFTGLTDKNYKKIFEGDILKIVSSVKGGLVENTRFFESEKRIDCAVVLQDNKTGGYRLNVYNKGKYKRNSKFTKGNLICYEAEVIGNIYDSPELLEKL